MRLAEFSIGDIAGVVAALAFAYLVLRLGSLVGKAGAILDETRIGVKGVADQSVPLIGEVTNTVTATNEQIARIDTVTTNVAMMSANVNALTSLFAATLGGPLVKVAAFSYGVRAAAAQATRDAILRAATRIFAKHGFDGGRVDQISKAAKSYDRMIYYYFGSKEGLYIAVLEDLYRRFNEAESRLALDLAQPDEALTEVIRFVWNYYRRNPEFITLLNTENLHRGRHIAKSPRAGDYSSPAVRVLGDVLERGVARGLFRSTVTARDIYLMLSLIHI